MANDTSEVYGLSREPVRIIGNIEVVLDLGDDQILEHEFNVLENIGNTCILGRDLLKKLGSTEFDWQSQQVRLGSVWKESRATIEGGEPLTRARVAVLEDIKSSAPAIPRSIINPDLPSVQKEALSGLLRDYESVFAVNPKQPQIAKGTVHRIITGSALPNKQRPIPVVPAVEAEIAKIVSEMLENGICRPSNSAWASRVLLVTKRDGSKRFVVDYRHLNEVTRIDSYPMPNSKDILDRMSGHSYFSFIDGASAYWSIEVEEADKHKTAFVTQRGLYGINHMPFGLVNSQSSYQRLMDETLKHVDRADPFVDDTCIHSGNFEQHYADLEDTFKALKTASIQLRRDKCSFGYPGGEFLGHMLSPDGRSPLPRLVGKIREAEKPTNRKQVQRFLGLANFYREYIPNFAVIAEPLYLLTRELRAWTWGEQEENAFRSLRIKLSESPITLAFPDWRREFVLQTDASSIAVGGVLAQRDSDGKLHPIAYFSSGLTDRQKKYSAGELECWGVMAATRKFSKYLRAATSVKIFTDHNPLVWLRKQKDPRGKYTRWILELESINYSIEFVKGTENESADYLSREKSEVDRDVNDEENHFERYVYSLEGRSLREEMATAQREDNTLALAMNQLEETGRVDKGPVKTQAGLKIVEGILYRGRKIVVPHSMKERIVGLVHNEGHFGSDKTILLTRNIFYWKKMNCDIEDFCRRCSICASNKPKNAPPEKLVPSVQATSPREVIVFDVATLPYASTNHRHFLLLVDTFSKFMELVPLFDQESRSIVQALGDGWIFRHGPPVSLLSDQGPNVDGIEVREFLARFNIEKKHSTAYHPEGDGQAERGIRAVKQLIRCLIAEYELEDTDWPSLLPRVSYILNTTPSASTGFTPYKVMFGEDPKPISGAELGTVVQDTFNSVLECG